MKQIRMPSVNFSYFVRIRFNVVENIVRFRKALFEKVKRKLKKKLAPPSATGY